MIDWLTLNVKANYEVRGGWFMSITPDGEAEYRIPKRLTVEGSHSAAVTVKGLPDGWVEISGNPSKFLQGHNLFGTDDLVALAPAFVLAVFDRLAYKPASFEALAIRKGRAALTRIDINRNYDLCSSARAQAAVRGVGELGYLKHRGRGSIHKEGSVYFGKNSRRWAMKFYAKRKELKDHPIPSDIPHFDGLMAYAEGLLRQEVTVRTMELKQRGLQTVENWSKLGMTPRALFDEMAGKLTIAEATMTDTARLADLPKNLRHVYQLWHDGHDLRELYPARKTFYRYRKALLEHGIDIAVKRPREVSNIVRLVPLLKANEVGVPDWATVTSLYFDPRSRQAA